MNEVIHERIKCCRKKEKLNQEELAKRIGVSLTTVKRWESIRNNKVPDSRNILSIAKVLNTTGAYLLGETDNPAPNTSTDGQIQMVLNVAKKIGYEEDELKEPLIVDISKTHIIITDHNVNITYSIPNDAEGRKSFGLFLSYINPPTVSNAINGDNNSGNKLGVINN